MKDLKQNNFFFFDAATKLQHLRLGLGHSSKPVVAGSPFININCLRFLTDFEYWFSGGFITWFCGPLLPGVMTCHLSSVSLATLAPTS